MVALEELDVEPFAKLAARCLLVRELGIATGFVRSGGRTKVGPGTTGLGLDGEKILDGEGDDTG
jgi:hypothetical protein